MFKWFKSSSEKDTNIKEDHEIYAKVKKTQALKALERSIFSNGTSVSNQIKPASSVDSVCSVASTASFSYVPIKVGFLWELKKSNNCTVHEIKSWHKYSNVLDG